MLRGDGVRDWLSVCGGGGGGGRGDSLGGTFVWVLCGGGGAIKIGGQGGESQRTVAARDLLQIYKYFERTRTYAGTITEIPRKSHGNPTAIGLELTRPKESSI